MAEISLSDSYDEYPRIEPAFQARLDETLHPRGAGSLLDLVAGLAVRDGARAVDIGCGEGDDAVSLATRFGLRVQGVDPVARHVLITREAAQHAGVADRVRVAVARAERLPLADGVAALVWCKEVLMHADVPDAAWAQHFSLLSS